MTRPVSCLTSLFLCAQRNRTIYRSLPFYSASDHRAPLRTPSSTQFVAPQSNQKQNKKKRYINPHTPKETIVISAFTDTHTTPTLQPSSPCHSNNTHGFGLNFRARFSLRYFLQLRLLNRHSRFLPLVFDLRFETSPASALCYALCFVGLSHRRRNSISKPVENHASASTVANVCAL
jgi:hypothetical protein